MTAMQQIKASDLATKIIAGLLAVIITLGGAWANHINKKLDDIDDLCRIGYGISIEHSERIKHLEEFRSAVTGDLKEIKCDLKEIGEKIR